MSNVSFCWNCKLTIVACPTWDKVYLSLKFAAQMVPSIIHDSDHMVNCSVISWIIIYIYRDCDMIEREYWCIICAEGSSFTPMTRVSNASYMLYRLISIKKPKFLVFLIRWLAGNTYRKQTLYRISCPGTKIYEAITWCELICKIIWMNKSNVRSSCFFFFFGYWKKKNL